MLSVFDKTSEVTTWKHDYIHRGSLQLGKATPAATPKDKVHFTLDHLGSTRVVTLDNGKTLETHHFFAYGEEFSGARASDEKLLFTGHERDKNGLGTVDDLNYMHARYYGPQLGRFLSADPVLNVKRDLKNPQNWNRYAYAQGSPLRFIDPTGKIAVLTGTDEERRKALSHLKDMVAANLRKFIRTTTDKDGRIVVDAAFMKTAGETGSGNFHALQTIAASAKLFAVNTSARRVASADGVVSLGADLPDKGIFLEEGGLSSIKGLSSVLVARDLSRLESAKTIAHELQHAYLFATGQNFVHEMGLFEVAPGEYHVYDAKGPVNLATRNAESEAEEANND